jgi:hypothetical protein
MLVACTFNLVFFLVETSFFMAHGASRNPRERWVPQKTFLGIVEKFTVDLAAKAGHAKENRESR